jgi:hypothetical protein
MTLDRVMSGETKEKRAAKMREEVEIRDSRENRKKNWKNGSIH